MRTSWVALFTAVSACHGFGIIDDLYRLDLLARLRKPVKVASISTYDRTGGNDDGFSGKYSYLRKEGDGLVIADLTGPGAIVRIWTATPTEDTWEFYFDGESTPRLRVPFRKIFTGEQQPFMPPLAGYGAGGFYSYVPLPFRKALKIVVRAEKIQFYQVNYAIYPANTDLDTFEHPVAREIATSAATPGDPVHVARSNVRLQRGVPASLFSSNAPGRIVGLRISPASALAGKDRSVILRMFWDNDREPAVQVPAGDFFGYAWGRPAIRSQLVGTDGDTDYVMLPMPYSKGARIELLAEGDAPSEPIRCEVLYTVTGRKSDEGHFHAVWRRENPTAAGSPFTFLRATGRGHIVGVILQAQGKQEGSTAFFEGDDQTRIDGELAVHGTGSEDFFNGGWYVVPGRWNGPVSLPLSGCLDYSLSESRTGGYRFLIPDAYSFQKEIHHAIEHAPDGNKLLTDYAAVTMFYAAPGVKYDGALPDVISRRVEDPKRLVFLAARNLPVRSFSWDNASVSNRNTLLNGRKVQKLVFTGKGETNFNLHHIEFSCEFPVAGTYRVFLRGVRSPAGAQAQMFRREAGVGPVIDFYAQTEQAFDAVDLGQHGFELGRNEILFKLIGNNPKSSGGEMQLLSLTFELVN